MAIGPRTLKIAAGVGTLAACGLSTLAVAADSKPGSAPLRPPVSGATPAASAVTIPQTPLCQKHSENGGAAATAAPVPSLDPTEAAVVQQMKGASALQRKQLLSGLTPQQRQQVTAYLAAARRRAAGAGTAAGQGAAACGGVHGGGSATSAGPEMPPIAPSVVDVSPSTTTPTTGTYVS